MLSGLKFSTAQTTFNLTYHQSVDGIFNIYADSTSIYNVMFSYVPPYKNYIFQKHDLNGNVIISKTYGTNNEHYSSYCLIKLYDDNFATGAYLRLINSGKVLAFIAKMNSIGDTLWTKSHYAPSGFDYYSTYMIETADHGFLITGEIADSVISDGDIFILKTDSLGNYQWETTFGGANFESGNTSVQTSDGGYLTAGWTRSFGFGNNSNMDEIVVKWDSVGNYQWHKTYGSTSNEAAFGIQKLQDGNYIIGSGRVDINNVANGKVIKIDESGNVIWQKFHGPSGIDAYNWVRELNNTDLVAVGQRVVNNLSDGFLILLDSAGNEKWRRQYRFGNSHCHFRDIQTTTDGGFICAGFVFDGASGGQDGWLVKLDSTGCLSIGNCGMPTSLFETPSSSLYEISVFPNPVVSEAVVKIEGLPKELLNQAFQINIFDINGRLIHSPKNGVLISDTGIQFIFSRHNLNAGVYLLEVNTIKGESLGIVKIILE